MRLCILYFFVLALSPASAAFLETHSIAHSGDSCRVNLLNRLSTSLRETDHETALRYAEEAFSISREIEFRNGEAIALENMGWIYYRKADYVKALQLSIESMKISEEIGDTAQMARAMNSIASVSFEQKQFNKALNEFKRALALGTEAGEERVICRTLNNIAYLYLTINNQIDSAEFYVRQAIQHTERIKDSYLTAFALRTLGDIMIQRGRFNDGMDMYQRSVNLSESSLNHSMRAAT